MCFLFSGQVDSTAALEMPGSNKNISKEAFSNKKHNQQFQKTPRNKLALDSTKLAISVVSGITNWLYSSERKLRNAANY